MTLSKRDNATIADAILAMMKRVLDGPRVGLRFDAIEHRLAQLEANHAALAATPSVKFCGTFQGGKSYREGDMVRHQSALWICKAATSGTPSRDFVGWELALKKGDAR